MSEGIFHKTHTDQQIPIYSPLSSVDRLPSFFTTDHFEFITRYSDDFAHDTFDDLGPEYSHVFSPDIFPRPKPIHDSSELLKSLSSVYADQVLLGFIAVSDQAKPEALQLVSQLMSSGIRFTYFSTQDERHTHAFGSKLGLFTGFNHYISLRPPYLDDDRFLGQSKIPRGVHAIRQHLDYVDNVPLLVSLFSDCTPSSTTDMVRVYQEHGEVVVSLSSSLASELTPAVLQADMCVTMDPLEPQVCRYDQSAGDLDPTHAHAHAHVSRMSTFEFRASTALTSAASAVHLPSTTNISQIPVLVTLARHVASSSKRVLSFFLGAQLSLWCVLMLSVLTDTPPLMHFYQVLIHSLINIPLLTVALFFSNRERRELRMIAPKNQPRAFLSSHRTTFMSHFLVRFALPALVYWSVFFCLCYHMRVPVPIHIVDGSAVVNGVPVTDSHVILPAKDVFFWNSPHALTVHYTSPASLTSQWVVHASVAYSSAAFHAHLLVVQLYSQVIFVMCLVLSSASFVSLTQPLRRFNPLRHNRVWLCVSVVVLVLNVCWVAMQTYHTSLTTAVHMSSSLWALLCLIVLWFPVQYVLDECMKRRYARQLDDFVTESFFEFDTKLGMHSPVGQHN